MLDFTAIVVVTFFCVLTALVVVVVSWRLSARRKTQVAVTGGTDTSSWPRSTGGSPNWP